MHKGNNYHLSGKKDDEILDSGSVRGDLDMVDEDKATQVLFCFLSFKEKEIFFVLFYIVMNKFKITILA